MNEEINSSVNSAEYAEYEEYNSFFSSLTEEEKEFLSLVQK